MSNKALARLWLTIDTLAKAAVYFGEDNRAWVMFRDRSKQDAPLLTTPFVNRLDECVVYLDEAHTRGVDLKFNSFSTAALTLSLKQTKDFTVQAAMRLRQLKTTQSVVFFAPPEVDGSIRDLCGRNFAYKLDSSDVVYWLLEQTCRTNEDVYGLHVAQGLDFCKRQDARLQYPDLLTNQTSRTKLLDVLREPEHQTLEELYGGASGTRQLQSLGQLRTPRLQTLSDTLFRESSTISPALIGAFDEVEQEREREVELQLESHAFSYLRMTEIGTKFDVRQTGSQFFVSAEFSRTVVLAKGNEKAFNIFLRPVEWILWSPYTQTALVIIPEEAEQLMAKLLHGAKGLQNMAVHLIAYSAPVTRSMTAFNTFRYYSLPPLPPDAVFPEWFRNEVGVLAGRLYIDYSEWSSVARYLHPTEESSDAEDQEADAPWPLQPFTDKPVDFLLEWLGSGRKAQDVLSTPVGFICMRRTVRKDHPFFLANGSTGSLGLDHGKDRPKGIEAADGGDGEALCRLRSRSERHVDSEGEEVSTEWSGSFEDEFSRVLDEEEFDLARSDDEFAD
ncbi:hypothetical protein ESCO_002424 [Escovopsis weberi]|uniref:ubiquitinyl hydrolase 1 n=1 Tax=Escovopsis weberi TaxID=150374 RepID=A0A0M8N087_ESCWE|nr:hypothetical protein ESCO_002424 [Escovopsis weberi]